MKFLLSLSAALWIFAPSFAPAEVTPPCVPAGTGAKPYSASHDAFHQRPRSAEVVCHGIHRPLTPAPPSADVLALAATYQKLSDERLIQLFAFPDNVAEAAALEAKRRGKAFWPTLKKAHKESKDFRVSSRASAVLESSEGYHQSLGEDASRGLPPHTMPKPAALQESAPHVHLNRPRTAEEKAWAEKDAAFHRRNPDAPK